MPLATTFEAPIMIPGYELIDELAGNETFRLYRGRQTSSGISVLIKAPRHDPPGESTPSAEAT